MKKSLIPLWLKILYSLFMAVLIPVYWMNYGPTNFLYFCDVALILTLVGIWKESRLLISMCAVGIVGVQIFWVLDYLVMLLGFDGTGFTAYMFNSETSFFLRSLSLYHGWLPFLLVYLVWKIGYDQRALKYWTPLAWALILIAFFFLPKAQEGLGLTPVNVNYVWGLNDHQPQEWFPPAVWVIGMMIVLPLCFYWPMHLVFKKYFSKMHSS